MQPSRGARDPGAQRELQTSSVEESLNVQAQRQSSAVSAQTPVALRERPVGPADRVCSPALEHKLGVGCVPRTCGHVCPDPLRLLGWVGRGLSETSAHRLRTFRLARSS